MDHASLQYDINPVTALNPDTGLKKPFFPIAWYSFGPLRLDQVKEVPEAGVNSIFFADCGRAEWADFCPVEEHFDRVSAALNWCQDKEIKVVIGFDGPIAAQRMIQHAMETGYNAGKVRSNLDQLVPGRNFNRIGHLLLYDDVQGQYFLIVTNNVSNEFEMELTIYDLPVPLNSHVVTEPHDQRQVELHELDEGCYKLTDRLFNHDVTIYMMK